MIITAVETTPISVPRKRAYGAVPRTALGPADLSEYGLVQVHTDTGITGLGELASVFDRRGPHLCRDVDERLTPVLIDRDPLAITGTLREMERQLPDGQMAIAGGDSVDTIGNSGFHFLDLDGIINQDFGLYKNFTVREPLSLQFRAEFFNLFNHPNFGRLGTRVEAGTFGVVSRATDERIIQFGLKFRW